MSTPKSCCARVGDQMADWAPRKGARCGSRAFCEMRMDKHPALPLCKVHAQKLIASPDAEQLARAWSAER